MPSMLDTATFTLDLGKRSGRISPLLFGHNLEHTRSQIWHGISAELLRGRKFFGAPQRNGVGRHWHPIGPPQTHFALEPDNTYTRRYDPAAWGRRREMFSQRICNVAEGTTCGIGQRGIPLRGGQTYETRIALRSDSDLPVTVRIVGPGDGHPLAETRLEVQPDDWREFSFTFTVPGDGGAADLQVVFDRAQNLYIGAVSLLPAETFHGMRPDVIQLLREIGCRLLRWPGGNFAGDYRWQDGLLPVDRRSPLASVLPMETLAHSDGYDCHEIGTDEFMALCRAVGAEASLTINPACEGPELAAAWVEYCNGSADTVWGAVRAERGHVEPYAVKYWSLGNEFGHGHMEGPNTPAAYAGHVRPHAEAMRAADPSIELVCSGDWSKDEWFTDGLGGLADTVDHVSHHHYTAMMRPTHMRHFIGPDADEDFQFVATNPTQAIAEEIVELRANIKEQVPHDPTPGIALDEWNVWHAWHRIPSVVEGIHHASMLNLLCNDGDELGLSTVCFFAPVNEGAIIVEADRAWLPAAGKVFSLFAPHQGNTRLDLGPQDGVADVYAAASLDEAVGQIVLTFVNRHPRQERQVRVIVNEVRWDDAEGLLLASPDFLPTAVFQESVLALTPTAEGWEFVLPKHSVARIMASAEA